MSIPPDQISVISSLELPTGEEVAILRRRLCGRPGPHVAILAGIRGDAPEGVMALHQVSHFLQKRELFGTVDLYPCANPLAAYEGSARWPFFDVDLGRSFPGRAHGHLPDRLAHALIEELHPTEVIFELGGPRQPFHDLPHVRVHEGREREIALAARSGLEFVWARGPGMVHASTFAAQFECVLRFLGGIGGRIQPRTASEIANGVLRVLAEMGVFTISMEESLKNVDLLSDSVSRVVQDSQVRAVRAASPGLFVPSVELGAKVQADQVLGVIVDAIRADEVEVLRAAGAGRVLSLREQPVVYPGSTVTRVVYGADDAAN